MNASADVLRVQPAAASERGRVELSGRTFPVSSTGLPAVSIDGAKARVVFASTARLGVVVPSGLPGGRLSIHVEGVDATGTVSVAARLATGLHLVDSPVFDRDGNLFVTYSGTRGEEVPVSIFRIRPDGTRETYSSGVVNPTSMAIGPDGRLYVSSRFEGAVYRLDEAGAAELFASDLGIPCGLAFGADGTLYVGDRSGTIFKVDARGHAVHFATVPSSVAAFHLALRADGLLYVTAPTLASHDALYEVDASGTVRVRPERFGRPQGMAFDRDGSLLLVEALAGACGVYRLADGRAPECAVAGFGLIGVAWHASGGLIVCSNDTAYRFPA